MVPEASGPTGAQAAKRAPCPGVLWVRNHFCSPLGSAVSPPGLLGFSVLTGLQAGQAGQLSTAFSPIPRPSPQGSLWGNAVRQTRARDVLLGQGTSVSGTREDPFGGFSSCSSKLKELRASSFAFQKLPICLPMFSPHSQEAEGGTNPCV